MSSILAPRHGYNVGHFPTRRHSTDSSTLHLSSLSNNSALSLIRQHAQPFSLDSTTTNSLDVVPQYFTSGLDTASLLSSDVQTAYVSGYLFSEVLIPTPVPTHKRRPEYFTSQPSRPPTPNCADQSMGVDGTTIYESQSDPRFILLTQRFINNNGTLQLNEKKQNSK